MKKLSLSQMKTEAISKQELAVLQGGDACVSIPFTDIKVCLKTPVPYKKPIFKWFYLKW